MPKIKPFPGIHPSPAIAAKVALQLENLSLDDAKTIRQENPYSYVNMLVPKILNPYLRGSRKELAYKIINENFNDFLEQGILVRDEKAAVYVYEISHNGLTQCGIWTVTSIDDYLDNTVRKHEHTRKERENALIEYIRQTGIDANPVLIAHLPNEQIDRVIRTAMETAPLLEFASEGERHKLWCINEPDRLQELVGIFSNLGRTYIADGHHRAASACGYGIERRKLNLKHRGTEEYNFFTSVYMSTGQLKVYEFYRLISDTRGLSTTALLEQLRTHFILENSPANEPLKPPGPRRFGMYHAGKWYLLSLKDQHPGNDNPVAELDVSLLQDLVLNPILGIGDPRTDNRIQFIGGTTPLQELSRMVDDGGTAIAFTLYPTSIDELIRVADSGEVMPPKSTWFEPKFRAGLLIHQVDEL
ncbi:DUF1015 domain-containing protein [Hufsiella ginkgonis]|uniref:DUF1015 family protein n=1 Tax=Hufsiella ginkgonis TaxID=2695274 RepID=A0A7K1XWW4_9SPHI|nr:DUF1015 family protein [Hufsiella ginkgonis]MXV15493.1 DUF1015 family protein [Hufsiella ginkgonis]